jgi:DNA-binding MarR family transcriptional regulator
VTISREDQIKDIRDTFHAVMWVAHRQFSQRLQQYGLTFPQFIVLVSLTAHKQACTMRDLTNVVFQDPATMTGIIDRLVKMSLVKRSRSEEDRRVVLVHATPAGATLVDEIKHDSVQQELACYSDFTPDQLHTYAQLLRLQLRAHIGRYKALRNEDLDAEIERLRRFMRDPIQFTKLEEQN